MDPHEVPGNFPENLTQSHILLSSRERELLACILRQARQGAHQSLTFAQEVDAVLSRAVGELLLARAAEEAGSRALEEIRRQSLRPNSAGPPSPSPGPRPPAPAPAPGPHRTTSQVVAGPPSPSPGPRPPAPAPAPGPHGSSSRFATESVAITVEERRDPLRAECVVFDEFLAPQELQELTRYTLDRESDFLLSQVISPGVEGGVVNPEYRRSRVLMELGKHGELLFDRIQAVLPRVLGKLGMDPFPITRVETQITASNDGDFFRHHSDNAEEEIARRQLTFVYFFHREPKAFHGGELRLHDSRRENDAWIPAGDYRAVVPEQNQIVFFRSELLHEITPIICPSQTFSDSRFTVNGWLHR